MKPDKTDNSVLLRGIKDEDRQNEDMNTTNTTHQWNEDDSTIFLKLAEVFVPARTEQITTLLQLLPARMDEAFTMVELAAGEGILARAFLEHFPQCHYIALDGSQAMRERMTRTLAHFGSRLEVLPFELVEQAWREQLPQPLRAVVSSLCVHHLASEGKQQLFTDMAQRLEAGGTLLLADIMEPATLQVATLYAQQYDELVHQQSISLRGSLDGFEQFQRLRWNYFRYDYGDPTSGDQPSTLSDQLRWLSEAGFSQVDCFWLRAGHAIYGGFKAK